jgi:serine protease Do
MIGKKLTSLALSAGLLGLTLGFSPLPSRFNAYAEDARPAEVKENLKHATALSKAFQYTAKTLRPSVVSVQATQKAEMVPTRRFQQDPNADPRDLLREFFGGEEGQAPVPRRFRGMPPQQNFDSTAQGTGVIVSKDGYILTNNHVVEKADKLTVKLYDGKEYTAKVIGTDKKTDLAVIKVNAEGLSAAELGDSDALEVGEWVLAIGSPFGLDQTVTAGIVSAKSRNNVGITDYEDFIQTDAAINPGNSGGPLVNLDGKVVGINTAIATRTGGYMGVGFTIPINFSKNIMNSLIKDGRVSRGRLGVMIQELTPDLAASFNYTGKGVLIGGVEKGSPAQLAGLQSGDIVTSLNSKEITGVTQLRNLVASTAPGSSIEVEFVRAGKTDKKQLTVAELDAKPAAASKKATAAQPATATELGMEVQALTPREAKRLGIEDTEGLMVSSVEPNSIAEKAGVKNGDIVVAVGNEPVYSLNEFNTLVKKQDLKKGFRLQVKSEGLTRYLFMKSQE